MKNLFSSKFNEQVFETLIDNSFDGIGIMDQNGRVKYTSDSIKQILGFDPGNVIGKKCFEFIEHQDFHIAKEIIKSVLKSDGEFINSELRLKKSNEETIYCEVNVKNLLDDETVNGIVFYYRDITERKRHDQTIERIAYSDSLTGLPNRNKMEHTPLHEINKSFVNQKKMAVLLLDIDRFKAINTSLGPSAGDKILKKVAKLLQKTISDKDLLFKLEADEFVIVLSEADRIVANKMLEKILKKFRTPFMVNHFDVSISFSIGISLYPENGESLNRLVEKATLATLQAKREGNNSYCYYSAVEHELDNRQLLIEMDLPKAIKRNELLLHFQPKVNLESGKIVGTEALIRWEHPKLGLISPLNFIPLAEETGEIIPIGKWVLIKACKQNKKWQDDGYSPMVISVNLSLRQFSHQDLVDTVSEVLKETGLPPQLLELEITESMTADIPNTIKTLNRLKALGVLISIDDFGTGYSTLNHLKEFPIDKLKIDKSFLHDLAQNRKDQAIVKTIITLAHNLDLSVVAEGIETEEHLQFLKEHLCNEGQGFLFSRPLPGNEIIDKFQYIDKTAMNLA